MNTTIADEIVGMYALDQAAIDQAMIDLDGTENKAKLGANAMLGVSMAVAKAAALQADVPLYQIPRRRKRQTAAGADDEHPQRRQARRQQRQYSRSS